MVLVTVTLPKQNTTQVENIIAIAKKLRGAYDGGGQETATGAHEEFFDFKTHATAQRFHKKVAELGLDCVTQQHEEEAE